MNTDEKKGITVSISSYFLAHEWEWLPGEKIARDCDCTMGDVDEHFLSQGVPCPIEYRKTHGRAMYRYIGPKLTLKRSVIECLREKYPRYCSIGQIAFLLNATDREVSSALTYQDLLPVEKRRSMTGYGQSVSLYRYVKNDCRSLVGARRVSRIENMKRRRHSAERSTHTAHMIYVGNSREDTRHYPIEWVDYTPLTTVGNLCQRDILAERMMR